MADLSDVEQALLSLIATTVYPNGTSQPSAIGCAVKLYRGWPAPLGLNADLSGGNQTVTIFSNPKDSRETTRYPMVWRPASAIVPTLFATIAGNVVTFGGSAGLGQIVGILVDGVPFTYPMLVTDTPATVAAALAAAIPGCTASGPTLSIDGAAEITARIEGSGTVSRETRRQEQIVTVSVWCNQPETRDQLAGMIDNALSSIDWVTFDDGSAGFLRYAQTIETDSSENANLYRRDLQYRIEYPTIQTMIVPPMVFGVLSGLAVPVETSSTLPVIGAIRFDAWYSPTDATDAQCAAALSSPAWSDRWPPNAVFSGDALSWPAATQASIDAEIEAAASAGLSFWAFDSYAATSGLSAALSLYLSSAVRGTLGFCMLGQISNWADAATANGYAATPARDVGLMAEAGYLTIGSPARPVYLVLDAPADELASLPDGVAGALAYVREMATAAGLPNPYIVWLSGAPLIEYDNVTAAIGAGADAAAAYCCPPMPNGALPYAALTAAAAADWNARAVTGFPMVPTAMTGWDLRPLIETPQPFYTIPPLLTDSDYYLAGTPEDIGIHVSSVADFVAGHPAACASGIALVYAWNEFTEGGWMMPTFGTDGPVLDRVNAVGAMLAARTRRLTLNGNDIA